MLTAESITEARLRAEAADLDGQLNFEVASAQSFTGGPYDLVTTFEALHDMGDPLGARHHAPTGDCTRAGLRGAIGPRSLP